MAQNERPMRVIYAKLTSTGAYDVVAHTPGVSLDQARTLAEQLLPGNPPLDAHVGTVIGYVRPQHGGHIVMRFARYPWKDGDRGDVYSTDIVWLPDDVFRRARCNAFAVVQRSDAVFDVLTELPELAMEERTALDERARLEQLANVRDEARGVIANTLAADRVLLVHAGDRAAAMELFTLLLPPSLRPQLTFLTQTFRVPAIVPRVTLVDRTSANLRDGAWTVLPSAEVDVPMELAGRLIALADDPDTLDVVQELYDAAHADSDDPLPLRAAVIRLTRLAGIAGAVRGSNAAAALRLLASADIDARERTAALRRLRETIEPHALRDALVQMLRDGGDSAAEVQRMVASSDDADPRLTGALVDALPPGAPHELVHALADRAARDGNVPCLLELLARDLRGVAAHLERVHADIPDDVRALLSAARRASAPHHDLTAAADVLKAAASIHPALAGTRAADTLHAISRDTVAQTLQHAAVNIRGVAAMRTLLDAVGAYTRVHGAQPLLPVTRADAMAFTAQVPQPACSALGAALLDRALESSDAAAGDRWQRDIPLVCTLLARGGAPGGELVRQVLSQRGVAEHDLVAMPGADELIPLLGGSSARALVTRRIVMAIAAMAAEREEGVQELAGAVYAALGQQIRITPNGDMSQRVVPALRAFSNGSSTSTAAAELCLELLGVITPPDHMTELEDAALGEHMDVRLRRLDRSIGVCRAAEDERSYDRFAEALESGRPGVDAAARERLRDALGTRGLSRRLMQVVASVIERDAS